VPDGFQLPATAVRIFPTFAVPVIFGVTPLRVPDATFVVALDVFGIAV